MAKFLDSLSISDFLSEAYSDCIDSISHLQEAIPYGVELLSESITVNEKLDLTPPVYADDMNVMITFQGHPQRIHTVVDQASQERDVFLDWQSISNPSKTGTVSLVRWDNEGYVVSSIFDQRNSATLRAFVENSGFTPGELLSNMMSGLDVSTMFADVISAVKSDATSALSVFTSKYGPKYQQLSSDARRVYDQIVAALSNTGNGYAGVVTFLINVYKTYTSAKQIGTDANGYIQFNNNEYYVQSFFDSVRVSRVITTITSFLGTILAFIGTPIMKVIGLATMGVSALADAFASVVCDSGASVSLNSLNNIFAKPIYQNRSLLSGLASIHTPWERYVYKSVREKGVLCTILPGLHIIQWYSKDSNNVEYLNTECYVRLDAADDVSNIGGNGLYSQHSKTVGGNDYLYGACEWVILDDNLAKYKQICSSFVTNADHLLDRSTFMDKLSFKEDGSLTEEADHYVFNCVIRNVSLACMWLLPHLLTGPGSDESRFSLNSRLALDANCIANPGSSIVSPIEQACNYIKNGNWTNMYQLYNALGILNNNAFNTSDMATDPAAKWDWKTFTNKFVSAMQSKLDPINPYTLATLAGAVGISGDAYVSANVNYSAYTAWDYSDAVGISTYDIPDRNAPFINPPQYSKHAFLATVLIGIAIIAATIAIAVSAIRITQYVKLRIQKRYQEVERLRYVYQDNPSDTNWAAYTASLKGYNRLAFFTGQSRLSLLTGWEVDSSSSTPWFESIQKSIDSISIEPSVGHSIEDVYRAIVG